jgi:DNA-binding transcriptional ArsR family regulator
MANQRAKFQFLLDYFKIPHSTLSSYLKCLLDNGILIKDKVGHETIYTVKEEDRVAKVLVAYKRSILDTIVDKTLTAWLEAYPQKETKHKTA